MVCQHLPCAYDLPHTPLHAATHAHTVPPRTIPLHTILLQQNLPPHYVPLLCHLPPSIPFSSLGRFNIYNLQPPYQRFSGRTPCDWMDVYAWRISPPRAGWHTFTTTFTLAIMWGASRGRTSLLLAHRHAVTPQPCLTFAQYALQLPLHIPSCPHVAALTTPRLHEPPPTTPTTPSPAAPQGRATNAGGGSVGRYTHSGLSCHWRTFWAFS